MIKPAFGAMQPSKTQTCSAIEASKSRGIRVLQLYVLIEQQRR